MTREIALKLYLPSQTLSEKPTLFSLDIRFFQGANSVLTSVGTEKK